MSWLLDPCPRPLHHGSVSDCRTGSLVVTCRLFAFLKVYISGDTLRVCTASASSRVPPVTLQCLPEICFSPHPFLKACGPVPSSSASISASAGQSAWCLGSRDCKDGSFIAQSVLRASTVPCQPKCVSSDRLPTSRQTGPFRAAELLAG